jgi:hypothetical protein
MCVRKIMIAIAIMTAIITTTGGITISTTKIITGGTITRIGLGASIGSSNTATT